jgi:hypothetical protein
MKLIRSITFILLLTLLSAFEGLAAAAPELIKAKEIVHRLNLAESLEWRHLVQYTDRIGGGLSSEIQSTTSFFAVDGANLPRHELIATIEAMFRPLSVLSSADDHPRCKFIARFEYLNDIVDFPQSIKELDCAKFNKWVDIQEIDSISLVFASGYFKNPASFYGHPLLKFNNRRQSSGGLLDTTINNGAIVPDNENPLVYMIKGIFGGYEAAFSDSAFYRLNHAYSESDLRDLWSYQLNLTQEQKERVIYYSWELMGQRFTYKFFSNNCGYFLEDLLLYALGKRISPRSRVYAVPTNTFFNLMQATNFGQPLVKEVSRSASRHSRLNENYAKLDKMAQKAVHRYLRTGTISSSFEPSKQRQIIDTLTDYYTYLIAKTDGDESKTPLTVERTKLYAKRLALDSASTLKDASNNGFQDQSSTPPHTGSRPSLIRLGLIHNSELGSGAQLRIRPVSYDLMDLDDGHIANSTLNMFNIEVTSISGKQRLTRFDLVDIKTLNISRTGLAGDGGLGWGLRFGLERANNSCRNCLLGQLSVSGIKAKQLNSRLTIYAQAEVSYHSSFENGSITATTLLSAVAKPIPGWKTQLVAGQRFSIDGYTETATIMRWENRFGDNPNRNVRFDVNYDGATEALLGLGWYW